jgi:hypothetical protein
MLLLYLREIRVNVNVMKIRVPGPKRSSDGIERTKYARPKGVMYLAKVNGVLLAGRDARTGFYAPQ